MGCEENATVVGEVPVVFKANSELARYVYARFVGEGHGGFERLGVAADQVGPLVSVHADAVTDAVGEGLVVGAEAGVGDDFAGGSVDRLAGDARACCGEGYGLGLVDDLEYLPLLRSWFAVDERSGDVGLVAFNAAPVVDEDNLAFADDLGAGAAVGQGRPLADLA